MALLDTDLILQFLLLYKIKNNWTNENAEYAVGIKTLW